MEKPTPTEAEQRLIAPGLRAGYYLAFFGMHVFTPAVLDPPLNAKAKGEFRVSPDGSRVQVWTMPTNEELIVAKQTEAVLTAN